MYRVCGTDGREEAGELYGQKNPAMLRSVRQVYSPPLHSCYISSLCLQFWAPRRVVTWEKEEGRLLARSEYGVMIWTLAVPSEMSSTLTNCHLILLDVLVLSLHFLLPLLSPSVPPLSSCSVKWHCWPWLTQPLFAARAPKLLHLLSGKAWPCVAPATHWKPWIFSSSLPEWSNEAIFPHFIPPSSVSISELFIPWHYLIWASSLCP